MSLPNNMNYQKILNAMYNISSYKLLVLSASLIFIFFAINFGLIQLSIAQDLNSSSTPSNYTGNIGFSTYKNDTMGFKIQYPVGWIKSESESKHTECQGSVCINADFQRVNFQTPLKPALKSYNYGNFGIILFISSKPMSYQDWLTWTLPMLTKNAPSEGFNVTESKESSLAGIPAYKLVTSKGNAIITTWTMIQNKKEYTLTYTTIKNSLAIPIIQHMLNSFELINAVNSNSSLINELG
jgi:hypothetical protein